MLGGQDTFELASEQVAVYKAKNPLRFYREAPEGSGPQCLSELFEHFKTNRFDATSVYLILVINPSDKFPNGGGRPINGGYNTGGGIIVLSTYAMDSMPNFQSTLQHELGHSFGLTHVDTYGYNMDTNPSIMAYNNAHHTNGFQPSPTPGILIAEDLRGLSFNKKAFPQFIDKTKWDGAKKIPVLGPMEIPGQPSWKATVTTTSGETMGSSAENALEREIKPSSEKAGFDPATMWRSQKAAGGWVSLDVTFPTKVTLDRIVVHSQYGGSHDAARQAKIQAFTGNAFQKGEQAALRSADAAVTFPAASPLPRFSSLLA